MNKVLGPFELDSIVTGDARALAAELPDACIDLILCDPVYWNIDDYRWLGHLAERVLVPGGALLAQVGEAFYLDAQAAIREAAELVHLPPIIEVYYFCTTAFQVGPARISSGYTPYIFATRGPRKTSIMNRFFGKRDKAFHEWGDGANFAIQYISVLAAPGSVVLDPFTGGGTVPAAAKTLGRHFVAFEIDAKTAAAARGRIANTQPPLPLEYVEQCGFDREGMVVAV